MTATPVPITHNPAAQRFECTVDGHRCVADYRLRDGVMAMTHTGVPSAVGGRGIAGQLVEAALHYARDEGLRVQPLCSYVDTYMRRHAERWGDLRA